MKKVLIVGFVWPESDTTAAGSRMMQLIYFFKRENYIITFASTASKTEYSNDLGALGVCEKKIELNHPSFDDFILNLTPDIVLFDRFLTEEQFGWRVAQKSPNAIRILDTEDLHFLRTAREIAFKNKNRTATEVDLKAQEITKREVASIYRCDFSLIISSYEMQLLQSSFRISNELLLHLPFMLDTIDAATANNWNTFKGRNGFVCIGNGKHKPNVDAVLWLHKDIWPKIRAKLPNASVSIYGAYLPQQIKEKHNPKHGFFVEGWTKDVVGVMINAKVNLAPMRFGAGIKGKLIDAMHTGLPSVTTAIGAEGMHGNLPWNGEIAPDLERFVAAAVALYTNEELWVEAQRNGKEIHNKYYSRTILEAKLSNKISTLQKGLQKHRNQNFIGSMLLHHTMASTKYLSKWIQVKENK